MNETVIIGAGKTGRGFLARLAAESGKRITFIDTDESLIHALSRAGQYEIHFFDNVREPLRISDYDAYAWDRKDAVSAALSKAEVIFVSVGGQNLQAVGKSLAALSAGNPLPPVIACENASGPARTLAEAMQKPGSIVSEATIFCTTIEQDGLAIDSENYPFLQCDADLLSGCMPDIRGIRPIHGFEDFLTRKLYTYNAASCVIAYLGATKGFTNYAEAANDPEILQALDRNYASTNRIMCLEFGYKQKDQEEFAALSKIKFTNRAIRDTIARNARDPLRKLAAGERIMGPIRLMKKYGEDASVMERTAAAALQYSGSPDYSGILASVCGVSPGEDIYSEIMSYLAGSSSSRP